MIKYTKQESQTAKKNMSYASKCTPKTLGAD